jgi:biotin transport system substrate-specific component
MTTAFPARHPLVLADLLPGALVRDAILVLGAAGFVGATAQVSIHLPGTPVPVTGQTLGVLLSSAALGWRRATMSLALYLVVGVLGFPWFAGQTSGVSASFGYVIGFVAAAAVVGALAGRGGDRTPVRMFASMVAGNAVIYLFGMTYLALDLHLGAAATIREGLRPFLIGDAVKAVIAAGLLPAAWALVNRLGSERTRP